MDFFTQQFLLNNQFSSTKSTSPYMVTPLTGSLITVTPNPDFKPIFSIPLLPQFNLNNDPDVHENITNSIYRKVFESWVYKSDYKGLFKYIKIVDNKARLVNGKSDSKSEENNSIDLKVRFLKHKILSKNRVKKILEDFVYKSKTNWYDIEKNKYFIKELILKYMIKKLKTLVELKE